MDSINKNQKEDNFENLYGAEGVKKIKDLADKAGSCFFCTKISNGKTVQTRPMAMDEIDEEGNFYFLSANDSHKNKEIAEDPKVQLFFQGSSHSDFMTLYGSATISRDQKQIDELWDPMMKNWFTEGKDDPRITVIKFIPSEGYYWDTKHAMPISLIKRVVGSIIGETMDDSIEGNIKV